MKIAALCCTYHRPHLLEHILECWRRQDYPLAQRELIILDDAGQYRSQEGEGWRLVSFPRRFTTLGEKRNASAGLASPDVDAFAPWDDDDLYLPWALSTCAKGLAKAPLSRPSRVLSLQGDQYIQQATGGLYHGGWAFTRDAFRKAGGYPFLSGPEDQGLLTRMKAVGVTEADPLADGIRPFYIYAPDPGVTTHISWVGGGDAVWDKLSREGDATPVETLTPHWDRDYTAIPIRPKLHPRPF
jgi:hypothetical protein